MAECKENKTVLNGQTILGLTFGQIMVLIGVVFSFAMAYADLNKSIADINSRVLEMERKQAKNEDSSTKLYDAINEIKQSQIRMEGKLDLKQDRFEK